MGRATEILSPTIASATLEAIVQAYLDFDESSPKPYKPIPPPGYDKSPRRLYGWEGSPTQSMVKIGLIFRSLGEFGQYLIALRGTQTWLEWVIDFDWTKTPFPSNGGVDVAAGFAGLYQTGPDCRGIPSLQNQILDWMVESEPTSLIITGHSLGGALASLMSYDISLSGSSETPAPAISLVTYASPNVGTLEWQSAFVSRFPSAVRAYNTEDIVPYAPPREFLGYLPVGLDWPVAFEPDDWVFRHCLDSLRTNHSLDNYQYVVNIAAPNAPPIWEGTFEDLSGYTNWLMRSRTPSDNRGAQRLEALARYLRELQAMQSRIGPIVIDAGCD